MDINDTIETDCYEGRDFPVTYIVNEWQWRLLLIPKLTTQKYNWKCKACQEKILDDVQMITHETHVPAYHVNCWKLLYERATQGIERHNENILRQIDEVELTPCLNARDVPNEP